MCAGPQETAGQIAPELNEFERQGIQFRVITEDMIPVCLDFLWEQFAPQVLSALSLISKHPFLNYYLS
jgi:hypothetical protein